MVKPKFIINVNIKLISIDVPKYICIEYFPFCISISPKNLPKRGQISKKHRESILPK